MSASPLVLVYNVPGTFVLHNYFVDASGSPLPGLSTVALFTVQSPNLVLQGVKLSLQLYSNNVTPEADAKTRLVVNNYTLIVSSATNTLGTLSWAEQYQNPVPGKDPIIFRGRVAKLSTLINSASGIFANYLFGNVIRQLDNTTGKRTISIFSAE